MEKKQYETLVALVGKNQADALLANADEVNAKGLDPTAIFKSAGDIPVTLAKLSEKMAETDPEVSQVLAAAVAMLEQQAEKEKGKKTTEDAADVAAAKTNKAVEEVIQGLLGDLPDCKTKTTLAAALDAAKKTPETAEENEEEKSDDKKTTPENKDAADDVTPSATSDEALEVQKSVLAQMEKLSGAINTLQTDVTQLQTQGNVRNIFAPNVMPSQQNKNIDPASGDVVSPEDAEAVPALKAMAEQLQSNLFAQNLGGNNG